MDSSDSKAASSSISKAVLRILEEGSTAVLVTVIEAPSAVGLKMLFGPSGSLLRQLDNDCGAPVDAIAIQASKFLALKDETLVLRIREFAESSDDWREAKLLFERLQPAPSLVVCGAGHVGAALANLAAQLGYRTRVIDDRAEFVARERFLDARIELITATSWREAVKEAVGSGRGVSVAIVTRGHSEDEECLRSVISLNADYVGLIGSKRRTNIVLDRLRESGATEDQISAVHAPVGLDIGAVTPEEVALAILAEIVLVRRGGKGGSLSEWRRGG